MKYHGYTIKFDDERGRYLGYTPDGRYFCSGTLAFVRKTIREHRKLKS